MEQKKEPPVEVSAEINAFWEARKHAYAIAEQLWLAAAQLRKLQIAERVAVALPERGRSIKQALTLEKFNLHENKQEYRKHHIILLENQAAQTEQEANIRLLEEIERQLPGAKLFKPLPDRWEIETENYFLILE